MPEREYQDWYGAVMVTGISKSISGTQWALTFGPVWETCGGKPNFEIDQQKWSEYADIRKLLERTDPKLLDVAYRQFEDPAQRIQEVGEVTVRPKGPDQPQAVEEGQGRGRKTSKASPSHNRWKAC